MSTENKQKAAAKNASGKVGEWIAKTRSFFIETVAEMRRCTWPGKSELIESTLLVVVVIGILSLFVWGVDQLARFVIQLITTGKI